MPSTCLAPHPTRYISCALTMAFPLDLPPPGCRECADSQATHIPIPDSHSRRLYAMPHDSFWVQDTRRCKSTSHMQCSHHSSTRRTLAHAVLLVMITLYDCPIGPLHCSFPGQVDIHNIH